MSTPQHTQALHLRDTSPWSRLEADRAFTAASRALRRPLLFGRAPRLG